MFTARYVLHSTFCKHSVFMRFVWMWEQTAIISLYSIDWLVFITETECVYCAVRSNSTFCPHSVFMCFVWISEQTAIISLYSIDWLVGFYNWEGICLLRSTDWVYIIRVYFCLQRAVTSYFHRPSQSAVHPSYHFAVCSPMTENYVSYTQTDRSLSHCAMKCRRQAAVCLCDFLIFVTVS